MMAAEKNTLEEVEEFKMEIKILKQDENKLNFFIKGVDSTFVNTLRRIVIAEVPVLAIEEVTFLKNTSALYDEFIAHRLGLVPLKTDLKSYELPENKEDLEKPSCHLNLNLKAKGTCTVYSSDLVSQDPKIQPVYNKIPIVKLEKGQVLELEAVAIMGQGKYHVKFSPGLAYYRHYPKIKAIKDGKYKVEVNNDKIKIDNVEYNITDPRLEAYQDTAIEIEPIEDEFIFSIESWGQLTPKEILIKASEMIDIKLEEFNKKLKKAK